MQETWVRSLGQEDRLDEGMETHSSILAWRIPMDRGAWRATAHGVSKSRTRLNDKHSAHRQLIHYADKGKVWGNTHQNANYAYH